MELFTAFIMLVASYVIQAVFTPKQQPPQPASLEDMNIPQAEEGTPQCVVFGDCWVEDWTVLGYGNFRTTAIKSKGGKK